MNIYHRPKHIEFYNDNNCDCRFPLRYHPRLLWLWTDTECYKIHTVVCFNRQGFQSTTLFASTCSHIAWRCRPFHLVTRFGCREWVTQISHHFFVFPPPILRIFAQTYWPVMPTSRPRIMQLLGFLRIFPSRALFEIHILQILITCNPRWHSQINPW